MADDLQNKVKIRFKFRSGEEFEAEGNPDFIEKQRADFLQLIGKDRTHTQRSPTVTPSDFSQTSESSSSQPQPAVSPSQTAVAPLPHTAEPAFYRRQESLGLPTPNPTIYKRPVSPAPRISRGISAAENARANFQSATHLSDGQELSLWEQIVRTDDRLVYLRRKSRLLSPDTAALVLIAAAKVLLQASDGYSALLLSKSLKKSGYGGERLDRVLGGVMKKGLVRSDGTKRSRLYLLSDEGFARAYVLLGKLAEE